MHIGGDSSVCALFAKDPSNGAIISKFGDRAIVIGNHQLYNDWMHIWWAAYTSRVHGGIFIILKDSLKHIPILGWGMQFFKFIFLTRKWSTDQEILTQGVGSLATTWKDFPAWLVIFPEGTTLSKNGVKKTKDYAEKAGKSVIPKNTLLPRSRGLRFCIEQLQGTVEYLYDATIYYSGIPKGEYGEEYYTLKRVYLEGLYPKDVSIYWRRFKIADIPYQDEEAFDKWLEARWFEKDELLSKLQTQGIEKLSYFEPFVSPLNLESTAEVFQIFSFLLSALIIVNLLRNHLGALFSFVPQSFLAYFSLSWILVLTAACGSAYWLTRSGSKKASLNKPVSK